MLQKCPECELQVSDKAFFCPHCGMPFEKKVAAPRKTKKRMRLPNGFGSISEIKNRNLRKPFLARVCVGKTELGRPILKSLKPVAYFKTYNEAYEALVEYNKNPYELNDSITVEELYDRWTNEYFDKISPAASRTVTSAWSYCSSVYKMRVVDLRARHIKGCMNDGSIEIKVGKYKGGIKKASPDTQKRIKSMFNLMLDYALEYELVNINYARTFKVGDDVVKESETMKRAHLSFTDDELHKLWENITLPFVDMILVQCYMGWRPKEICELRSSNVNLENKNITGGMKTEAGTNRTVPIHNDIVNLIESRMAGSKYLFLDENGKKLTYDKYKYRFEKVMSELGLDPNHRPHDCRKTFVTEAKKYKVDDYAIKRIVGHSIQDITEKVYTDRPSDWLNEEINKIKIKK